MTQPAVSETAPLQSAAHPSAPPSQRPEMTAAIMQDTGLDGDMLHALVHGFYDKVRSDPVLGPVFAERVTDWGPHLEKMVTFWHSVALMTGTYKGAPMPAHMTLPVDWSHFTRWLDLFRATAHEICPPEGAAHVIERAERIAKSLHMAIEDHAARPGAIPRL